METPHKVAKAPDGNGGVYSALKSTKLLEDMAARGVKYVDCYGVDNAGGTLIPGVMILAMNIVSTVNLDCRFDLKQIYNPKRFAAVIVRIRDPKTTTLILFQERWFAPEQRVKNTQNLLLGMD